MSDRRYHSIALPQGHKANPLTITSAVGDALAALEKDRVDRGLRAVWDTVEINTETDIIEDRTFAGAMEHVAIATGILSVLALDPKEAAK